RDDRHTSPHYHPFRHGAFHHGLKTRAHTIEHSGIWYHEGLPPAMIRSHRGKTPKIAVSAYIDPSAVVIGDVEIGERASVWPNVTIRGDVNTMRIGADTNIQ